MKPWEKYNQGPWAKYADAGFEEAVGKVLKLEGGYANDPDDRGGETKYGISKRAHPDVDIPTLTVEAAKSIYKNKYWDAIDAGSLPEPLREVAFDAAVNQGVGWTKEALKEAAGDAKAFIDIRARRYADIVTNDPDQKKFARGWEKRLESFTGPWLKYSGGNK